MTIPKTLLLCIAAIVLLAVLILFVVFHNFSKVEVHFDINKLDVDNVASHPQIRVDTFNPVGGGFTYSTPSGHWGRYNHRDKLLKISCSMHDSTYITLRSLGFKHWQILSAKKERLNPDDEDPNYKLKVGGRIYSVVFGRFEQHLGNGIGIDRATIGWN
ncbi:hypothetical protein F4X33_03175 [Candidatus Poribacteria bacterium]|nr:hypothetical protein [Candidatus Poribacteria bacterium]